MSSRATVRTRRGHRSPAVRRTPLRLAGALFALAGCGGDGPAPPPVERSGLREKAPIRAQIEKFAEVRLPSDAAGLEAWARQGVDTSLSFRLPMSRADFDAFYRDANFTEELTKGERPSISEEGHFRWGLDRVRAPWGTKSWSAGSVGASSWTSPTRTDRWST